ncbi:MAG: CBS domain-containing protein [Phycisphaerales bacterium JB060]
MRIEDIMTRQVKTAKLDDTLEHVQELFTRYRFRHMPIVGDKGRLVGIISDRDMLANVSPFAGTINERAADANSLKRRAHQIMTRDPQTVSPQETAEGATLMLLHRRISALPVVDQNGRLVGIVTMRDLVRWLLNHAGVDQRKPTDDAA